MSEEEAKKERDDIEAEIAREKGIKPDAEEEDAPKDDEEPAEDKQEEHPEEEEDKDEPAEDGEPKDEEEEKPAEPKERKSRYIPLPKYQDLKRTSKEALDAKDAKIAELQKELEKTTTTKAVGDEVKAYAEEHGMTEKAVYDLLKIAEKAHPAIDPETKKSIQKAEVLAKKQEAEDTFRAELDDLIKEFPEAADAKDKIRAAAFKEGNLTKTLYEIFMREVKPSVVSKKKTGEASRGAAGRDKDSVPDFAKLADDLKAGKQGILDKLSGEEQDKLFDWMEKNGSRYKR